MFGLDISDASIEVLQLKKSFGRIKLVGYGRRELPKGIVRDGIILKKKELGEAIKKLLENAQPRAIRDREVILSLPESRVFTHIFKFPANLKIQQIAEILKFEVPNALPISPEEVYSDFLVLGKEDSEQEVFYVAVPKKVVDDLCEVLKSIGLTPRIFDMESISFARALGKEAKNNALIVDIGARTTIISVFDKGGIRFTTNLPVAGNAFTEAVAKKMKIEWEEAEKLKKVCGLNPKGRHCRDGQVFLILQAALQPILREIQKTIKFYEEKSSRKIQKIFLCGGSSMLPNIVDYLKENFGFEVFLGKPYLAPKVKINKGKITPLLLNVFGLALRGVGRRPEQAGINLMSNLRGGVKGGSFFGKKFFIWLFVICAILALGGFGVWGFSNREKIHWFGEQFLPAQVSLAFEMQIPTTEGPGAFGRILEIIREGEDIFLSTGKRIVEGRAEGKVKIINNLSSAQTLIATTRMISEDGILFRLKNDVRIPARGSLEAEVYADQIGASGDIGPSKFTIPGLSPSLQKSIYAQSSAPMTGGALEVAVVSVEDIDKAKTKLEEEILESAKMESRGLLERGETLIPVILDKEILETKSDPEQDKLADEFRLQIKMKIKFLAVLENDLKKEMRTHLTARGAKKVENYQFENIEYSLLDFDETSGEVFLKISTEAVKK